MNARTVVRPALKPVWQVRPPALRAALPRSADGRGAGGAEARGLRGSFLFQYLARNNMKLCPASSRFHRSNKREDRRALISSFDHFSISSPNYWYVEYALLYQ